MARAVWLIACLLCGMPALAQTYAEGLRAYDAGDYASARAAWAPLAALGHPEATVGLAQLYLDGLGVDPDPERALALYRSAAEQGDTYAMRKLGVHYLLGEIVPADPATGLAWRLRAARAGDPKAQYEAALQLLEGLGVEQDAAAAVSWLRKAAEAGVDEARLDLARILADPEQEPYDIEKAVELYETLAIKGHVDAQLALVGLYQDGGLWPRDFGKARVWARRVAAQDATLGVALLAGIDLEQEPTVENLRVMAAATLRLIEQRAEELKQRHVYEGMLDDLCALEAVEAANADEAALKREIMEEVSSFFERLRARGETPCR